MRLRCRERPFSQPIVMYQKWRDLLFLHWAFEPALIQQTLPPGLRVDCFDGQAYVGIVPFFMRDIRPRFLPSVPWISNFLELNVRTYVFDEKGTPGVWFYSLDCSQPVAVWLARTFFRLPYFWASMRSPQNQLMTPQQETVYFSQRRGEGAGSRYRYRGEGELKTAVPETLEFFLVERYILFSPLAHDGLGSGQVVHAPYTFSNASVPEWDGIPLQLAGLPLPNRPPDHACWSPGVDVDVYPLQKLGRRP